ncbi:MAG: GatB/YqeY domain-containing protein [Deltaproteobacteria bacterium]|nr:GatB/YqeY domain-containing protein [Deltaproteobacteria bacterium]MBW2448049.1 GatB/YqeY domain-containing protein [Deltaproteobacteria bacterium]
MGLKEQLDGDLKEAMRGRERLRLETIRSIRGALKNKEIETGGELPEADALRVVRTLVKQREESIERYREAGRDDLADKEAAEREVLLVYLPDAPDAAAVDATVAAVIAEIGASSPKEMGRVMKESLARLGPAADGKAVSAAAKRLLAGG